MTRELKSPPRIHALSHRTLGALLGCLMGLSPLAASADPTPIGPSIIDPEFDTDAASGTRMACRQTRPTDTVSGFYLERVNAADGTLDLTGSGAFYPIQAKAIADSRNGPEIAQTPEGIYCAGTREGGGIVLYDATTAVVEHPDLTSPLVPFRVTCPTRRYIARTYETFERSYLVVGDQRKDFATIAPGVPERWLDCRTVVVNRGAQGVSVVDIYTGKTRQLVDEEVIRDFGFNANGKRLVASQYKRKAEVRREGNNGKWNLVDTLVSPEPDFPLFYNVEGFEWQGVAWISGNLVAARGTKSFAFIHRVGSDQYRLFGTGLNSLRDTETVVLPDGRLAVYYSIDYQTVVTELVEAGDAR